MAAAIGNIGKALYGDQAGGALKREKLRAAERENVETDNLMALTAGQGAQNLGANPLTQALLVGSGYKPQDYANIGLMGAANEFGAADPRTANAQVAAGKPFSSTGTAFYRTDDTARRGQDIASSDRRYGVDVGDNFDRAKLYVTDNTAQRGQDIASSDRRYGVDVGDAFNRFEFQNKPQEALINGQPVFAPQGDVTSPNEFGDNYTPILSDTEAKGTFARQHFGSMGDLPQPEQNYIGADSSGAKGALKTYQAPSGSTHITRDGITDVQTGQPLEAGGSLINRQGGNEDLNLTNSVQTDLQSDEISYQKFNSLLDVALPLTENPELFGPQGFIRAKGQEVMQAMGGLQAVVGAQNELTSKLGEGAAAVLPELYDPRLSEVETLWGLIVYQGASALAGQENRSVSDKDVQFMRQILGDPHSFFSSNISAKTKLTQAKAVVERYREITNRARTQGLGNGAVPGAAPAPQGQPVQIQDAAGYDALPPGATYFDPNGIERTKGAR